MRAPTVRKGVGGFDYRLPTGASAHSAKLSRSRLRRIVLSVLALSFVISAPAWLRIRGVLWPQAYAQSAGVDTGGAGAVSGHRRASHTLRTLATTGGATTSKAAIDSHPALAAKTGGDSPFGAFENSGRRGPVDIQSDSLALDYKNNSVMFRGKVRAAQADGQLTSNTLNVKYGKDFREIQEMIADGDVHISQGVRWCSAEHGVMSQLQHTVILTGSPVCHDANDQISGTRITLHTDSGRSEVEGGVKAVIFPHQSKTRDNSSSDNQQ